MIKYHDLPTNILTPQTICETLSTDVDNLYGYQQYSIEEEITHGVKTHHITVYYCNGAHHTTRDRREGPAKDWRSSGGGRLFCPRFAVIPSDPSVYCAKKIVAAACFARCPFRRRVSAPSYVVLLAEMTEPCTYYAAAILTTWFGQNNGGTTPQTHLQPQQADNDAANRSSMELYTVLYTPAYSAAVVE